MKKKILLGSLIAALAIGGFIVTRVQAGDTPGARATGRLWQRIAEKLDLTSDQRAQIKTVLAGESATLAPLVGAVHEARKELRTAIRASDANETSVRAAAAPVATAEANLAVERMRLFGKIAPLLTGAQRRQLADLQAHADGLVDTAVARLGSGLGE